MRLQTSAHCSGRSTTSAAGESAWQKAPFHSIGMTTFFATWAPALTVRRAASAALIIPAADQELRHADRRLAVAHGHALPVLAAGADAPADVPADAIDGGKSLRT